MNPIPWLVVALSLGGCGSPTPESPGTPAGIAATAPRSVDIATLKGDLERGAVPLLVDVRTEGEYVAGHVPGAVNTPVDQIVARAAEIPSQDAEVYLICQSGRRSALASTQLAAKGFRTVNVEGGTSAWISAGHPVQ